MRYKSFILILAAMLVAAGEATAQSVGTYRITQTFSLGGDGGWDYVIPDPPTHRVYIGRSNRVMVMDGLTGKLLGEVTGINGAHGAAIAARSGYGFATSGNDGSVVMFDLKTLKSLKRIPAGEDADAVIFDEGSNRVFTFNGDAHSSTVIDAANGKLVTNIPLGGKPEYGVSAGDGKLYVNLTDLSEIAEIDARKLTVTKRWSTAPCRNPVPMAIDVKSERLFSGCRSGVMAVSNYKTGKIVATLPIGSGVDGAGYDPVTHDAFASNSDGTLTVIHQSGPDSYSVAANVPTSPGSRNMGLDPATHRIYLAAVKFAPRPDSSAANPRRRPQMIPGSFSVIVVERK